MVLNSKRITSMLIVFVIVFTYMGQTLEAIATTDALSAITNGFFNTGEMKFNSYFDENESQNIEKVSDVNEKATLIFEVSPNDVGSGFLKDGKISASSLDESEINFKFSEIKNITIDEPEEIIEEQEENVVENNIVNSENVVLEENIVELENTVIENNTVTENTVENSSANEVSDKNDNTENVVTENEIQEENVISNEVTSRSSETRSLEDNIMLIDNVETDELVDEEQMIQDATEEVAEETYEELTAKDFEIEIISENEIKVQNVIYNTKIEVEIEYNKKESLNISDLYKQIELKLTGTYININLERIEIEATREIVVGWTYNKEFELSGEYTKFSPFKLGDYTGIIVESKINVKREIEDESYLPIKQTTVEIDVPNYNGKQPETVNVQSTKLMATKGEDLGDVSFTQDNWNYDAQNQKIVITVTNENNGTAEYTTGEDEYLIVYRYNDYTENEFVEMSQDFKVTVEEYSSNNNVFVTKEWHNSQEIKSQANDLITYNIGTTEEKLNVAKINANYNSEEAVYESEFTTTVNVNILTSDLLEELKINSSKETYLDSNFTEFDASGDVYYNKVKFKYNEIKNMLQNGAVIEIQTLAGELLYTLNNESVQNDENCEIVLGSKEKGIFVVFKNVSVNGNISIEFTKAIGKSNYDKAAFNNFREIKNYVSAELKYKNYEERYAISEIWAMKEMEQSQTVAEISLSNNNLSTTAKNDGVEVRIALNNDKQNTDLYKNPTFELVFPKYVKNVTIESINLMYKSELNIANFQTYTENEIVKLRVELTGTQTEFCESVITDGTNILLNLNIELDEYTPRKQDQIKMYYCNEAVTNYESQTKWTISKPVPNGILKDTNGFDVAVVNYQAPNGLVTANSIINYDGQASKVKSVGQGERTVEVDIYKAAQIATMELIAMNNTENSCTDAVFLGRVPFVGNKSVITGQDLGSTVTTTMLSGLQENIQNINMATIYYSENENATQDLSDNQNGWTQNVVDWRNIKSYMIVIKGEIVAGTVLRYTYDFEIPGGLYYDQSIYGSFGGFYNNNSKVAIYYESTEADKVGIKTKSALPLKLNLEVDAGDKEEVKTNSYLKYTVTVSNEGEEAYSDIKVNAGAPDGANICDLGKSLNEGNNGYIETNENAKVWEIAALQPGETKTFSYMVKVKSDANLENALTNRVSMTVGSLDGQEILSNEIQNSLVKSKFDIEVSSLSGNFLELGSVVTYRIGIVNTTQEDSGRFTVVTKIPKGLKYNSVSSYSGEVDARFDETSRVLTMDFDNLSAKTGMTIYMTFTVENNNTKYMTLQPEVRLSDGTVLQSTGTDFSIRNAELELTSSTNFDVSQVAENQEIEIVYNLKSIGEIDAKDIDVNYEVSEYLENCQVKIECNSNGNLETFENELTENAVTHELMALPVGTYIQYRITGKIKNIDHDIENIVLSSINFDGENITAKSDKKDVDKIKDLGNNEKPEIVQEEEGIYEVSGNVWVDDNGDGQKVDEIQSVSGVQVQLLKDGNMIKATTTDSSGNYKFAGLANGNYSIVYNYSEDTYTTGKFTQNQATEITTSKGYELENGKAVSDEIIIADANISDVNLGLQEKDKFDFNIAETISKAIVNVDGEETVYEYSDLNLAKIEIEPNKIDDARVKFEYKITVENTGNVAGKITSIVDYLPAGMQFVEAENEGWSNGVDGNIYNDSLRDVVIQPGDTQELTLILSKKFNEDNTGILSNKVKIAYTENEMRMTEAIEGNFATQETIVTVTQGSDSGLSIVIATISLSGLIAMFAYMIKTGKLDAKFNGKGLIKKVYK